MWQILITLQNPLTKDFRRISFESSGSFGQSYQIVMEDTLCRWHLKHLVCKQHGQGRDAKFDRGGASSNNAVTEKCSTILGCGLGQLWRCNSRTKFELLVQVRLVISLVAVRQCQHTNAKDIAEQSATLNAERILHQVISASILAGSKDTFLGFLETPFPVIYVIFLIFQSVH